MSETENMRGGHAIFIGVTVLLMTYIFLPVVFMMPISFAVEHHWVSQSSAEKIFIGFAPLGYIADRVPAYSSLIEAEFRFCESHGLLKASESICNWAMQRRNTGVLERRLLAMRFRQKVARASDRPRSARRCRPARH
jgi:hypothetical protein